MIKKFLLAVMLIWCAADGMAQNLIEEKYDSDPSQNDLYDKYWYDIYDDGTAILVDISAGVCASDVYIPATVRYNEKEYTVVKVADQVFSMFHKNMAIITIDENVSPDLVLGSDPLGYIKDDSPEDIPDKPISVYVPPCVDASKWKNDFDVFLSMPSLVDAVITEPLETTYNGNKPFSLTTPYIVNTTDYTLSITKLQPLNDKGEYWSISAIDFTVIDNNNNNKVCHVTGDYLEIEKDILKINPKDKFEIKPERLFFVDDVKYYPIIDKETASNGIIVTEESFDNRYDFNIFSNNRCYFLGESNDDTVKVDCSIVPTAVDGTPSLQITIPEIPHEQGSGGYLSNYKGISIEKHLFTVPLKGNKVKVFLTDDANIQVKTELHPLDDGNNNNNANNQFTWNVYSLTSSNPDLFGGSTPTQAAVYTLPSLPETITKTYDKSASFTIDNMPKNIKLHIAYSLNDNNVNTKYEADGMKDIGNLSLLADYANVSQNRTIEIPVEAKFVFLDKDNKEDASVGKDKKVKLILTPTDQSSYPDFYEALIDNEIILDGYSGTITPMQLSEKDIADIETLIKKALEPTKIVDGTSDINCSQKELTYITEKYKVNVTINEAKYLMSEKEVSTPGSGYDMKVTYEVDHNFCFGSTQTGYEYQKSVIFNNEGEIRQTPSVSDDDFATAFKAKYKNYLSKTYDGSTNFLGFNPQDNVLSVAVGSATDAVAAQIKITSVAYDEKNAGSRSLKVECTPVQGSPYTISSPVTITGDDIKITPFVLDNIADYVKEDEHYKKDKTYNGYTYVEMNNPVFTIPGVTVNGTQETVDGGTIADAIYTKDGAEVSAVGDDYTITATLSIRVDRNYCLGIDNSGNYIYGNTFIIGTGSITPAELDIQFAPEDLDGKVSLTRKYNQADDSAEITNAEFSKNGHNFIITHAKFADNSVGENKQIVVTIQLNDGNNNYTLKNSTVIIPDGTILGNDAIIIKEGSIQQKPNHQQAYCIEGVNGLELKFQRVAGDIESFKITIDGDEKLSEIMSTGGEIKGDTLIYVNIPSNTMPGKYSGTIQFFGKEGKYESEQYKFDFIVDMPPSMVKYLYHNVIFVDNHDTLFTEYQWYKNGEKIEGATRQYYYEKTLDGEYYVACKHNSGISLHSCPVKGEVSTKVSVSSVKVYPNPAKANIPFNLELVGGNGNYSGAEMLIYNNSGNLVKHITNITDIITLTLPQGNYSGALFFNGEKTGFKIIVK